MQIQSIGVVGAGVIGCGVAHDFGQVKIPVVLVDVSDEKLKAARRSIRDKLRLQRLTGDRPDESTDTILERIRFSCDYDDLKQVDLVVENVCEKWQTKQRVYAQLDRACQEQCIFAANTSAFPVSRIAAETKRPDRVLGAHFMNPPNQKTLVEVIPSSQTSKETLQSLTGFLAGLGKKCVVVGDSPGFVSNRVMMMAINEAILVRQENVATAADIDRIFRDGFGHKMGPLETADLIGLDTILNTIEVLREAYPDSRYQPCELLSEMVSDGRLGQKSGEGFYSYE